MYKVFAMKYILFTGLLISGFYIAATQMLLTQVNNLKNFYSNVDVIAQSAAEDKSTPNNNYYVNLNK